MSTLVSVAHNLLSMTLYSCLFHIVHPSRNCSVSPRSISFCLWLFGWQSWLLPHQGYGLTCKTMEKRHLRHGFLAPEGFVHSRKREQRRENIWWWGAAIGSPRREMVDTGDAKFQSKTRSTWRGCAELIPIFMLTEGVHLLWWFPGKLSRVLASIPFSRFLSPPLFELWN